MLATYLTFLYTILLQKKAGNVLTVGLHTKRKHICLIKSMEFSLKSRKFTDIQRARTKEQRIQWSVELHAHTLY